MIKRLLSALLLCSFSMFAFALDAFVIKDIRVEGAQRIEVGTIFTYLPVKVGEKVTDEKASEALKALYGTGFFSDVVLENDHDILVVKVHERPAIAKLEINGSKEFPKDQLKEALKSIGLVEGRIYDKSILDKAEKELKRQYLSKGHYAAQVIATVTPMERNRVAITLNIVEGDTSEIKSINIIGAKAFKEKELLSQFKLSTHDWISWYTKNDQYSKQKLSGDLETLKSYYEDRGYLEFSILSTQVAISPDKLGIFITVSISEGKRYTVSDVKLAGRFVVPKAELAKLVKIKKGEVFSRQNVTESVKAMSDRLANEGYSFANINANPQINKDNQTASFTFVVDPGRRVYVRHVNIFGNARTRDEVIRREVRQLEGGWYSIAKINRSKERIDRLGFFKEVTVDTKPVPGTTDQVDVNFTVVEQQTGSIQLGAGYSQVQKIILSGSISQNNLFGTGNSLTLALNTGLVSRNISLTYFNPYWTEDGIGRSYSVYDQSLDTTSLVGVSPYSTNTLGADTHWTVPLSETNAYTFGFGVESTSVNVYTGSPLQYLGFVNQFGDLARTIKSDIGFSKDTRDSILYPTKGANQRYRLEVGLPGADLKYYKATADDQWLSPTFNKNITFSASSHLGYANGYGGQPLAFFKNFFAGGPNSVRGYYPYSMGPQAQDIYGNVYNLGGAKLATGSLELYFPFPGLANDRSFRLSTFIDGGNVFGQNQPISTSQFRYSYGVGLNWYSPLGPLQFSYAFPFKTQPYDNIERLQFQLGSTF